MKKLVLAVLVGLMIAGAASIASAEVTVGGNLEIRYDLWNNLVLDRSDSTVHTNTFFADRILLHVDAKVAEGLEGYVELATESTDTTTDERQWGFNNTGAVDQGFNLFQQRQTSGNVVSPCNYQGENLAIRQAWINFMIPGAPVGIKIGHQPLALGHGIFLDSHREGQDAILIYSKPIPELLLAGVYVKAVSLGSTAPATVGAARHDVDIYAALANYTWMENNTVGVFNLWAHDAGNATGMGLLTTASAVRLDDVGVIADGVIGLANYKFEADYQNINGDRLRGDTTVEGGINNSWAAMVGGGYKVMPMLTVSGEAAYGSGTTGNGRFGVQQTKSTGGILVQPGARTYNNPYGTTSYNYAFLYNDKIGQGPLGAGGGLGLGDGTGGFGLANTGYIKLSVAATPMDKLTAGMDVLYLRASNSSFVGQSRDLGWEVDANVGYKIYDNLKFDLQGGVFIPGAWYAFQGRPSNAGIGLIDLTEPSDATSPVKRDIAYGLETKLTMNF